MRFKTSVSVGRPAGNPPPPSVGTAARYLIDGWALSGVILAQTGQPYSNAIGGDSVNDTDHQTSRVPQDGRNTNYAPTISNWQANFLSTNIRTRKYNFVATTGAFVPTTNFATYASQTDNGFCRSRRRSCSEKNAGASEGGRPQADAINISNSLHRKFHLGRLQRRR